MSEADLAESLRPWLREPHASSYEAALEWLLPRCRTPEERTLAPALLLLLSPFNALVVPCRPVAGSCVNFQVTLSRAGAAGPERLRLTVRAGPGVRAFRRPGGTHRDAQDAQDRDVPDLNRHPVHPGNPVNPVNAGGGPERLNARTPERLTLWLEAAAVTSDPLGTAVGVLQRLIAGQPEYPPSHPSG